MADLHVLAIDPGVSTGWAKGLVGGDGRVVVEEYGTEPDKRFMMRYARTFREASQPSASGSPFRESTLGQPPFDVIVYESWRLRREEALSMVGSDMPSSQVIGVIRNEVWLWNARAIQHVRLITQNPQDKRSIDQHMGGAAKYLPKGDFDHARDALRHLYYLAWGIESRGGLP